MAKKEVHNAIVTRNTDEDLGEGLRGAIFFEAATLFEGEYPLPAEPCFPFAGSGDVGSGMFWVPEVGDEIEVEVLVHDDNTPYDTSDAELPEPRYRCMVYSVNADIADEFKINYPKRMGWKSRSGHIWLFDDQEDKGRIEINSAAGHSFIMDDTKGKEQIALRHVLGALIQIDKKGSIKMIGTDGGYIFMNAESGEISALTKDGAMLKLKGDALLSDKDGNTIGIEGGTMQILTKEDLILNGAVINLESGSVNIGKNAFFSAVISENLSTLFDAHFHITAVGPSGPPAPPITYAFFDLSPVTAPTASFIKLKGNLL